MAEMIGSGGMMDSLLLAKAVLAWLAVALFIYYKLHWDRVKRHLPINFFYTKWRMVRHAVALGLASIGFAVGFTLELFGGAIGMSPTFSKALSSVFEIGSLAAILWVFVQLALDDVPHFAHISETAVMQQRAAQKPAIRLTKTKVMKKIGNKKRKKR